MSPLHRHLLYGLVCLLIALLGWVIHDLRSEDSHTGEERTIFLEGQSTLAEGDAEVNIENTYKWAPGQSERCEHPGRRSALSVAAHGHEAWYLSDASASTEDLFRDAVHQWRRPSARSEGGTP
jgi:hypothetical protein